MKQSIQKYLGVPETWPVVEKIKHEIILMPSKEDIKTAKRKDPQACALHNAACRMFGIPNAAIGAKSAYIPQRDAKGKYYIARVRPTGATARAIRNFDKTGKMPVGGFHFVAMPPSSHFKRKRAYMKRWDAGLIAPSNRKPTKGVKYMKKTRSIPLSVRTAD